MLQPSYRIAARLVAPDVGAVIWPVTIPAGVALFVRAERFAKRTGHPKR